MNGRDQALADKLQSAIPRAQLILQSAQRQHEDAAAVLDALAHAVTLLQPVRLTPENGRTVAALEQAVVRSGHTFAEVAHLSGLIGSDWRIWWRAIHRRRTNARRSGVC